MDFLVTPRHRWVYVALFFVMAASLINAYDSLDYFNIENIYLRILYSISKSNLVSLSNHLVIFLTIGLYRFNFLINRSNWP